MKKAKAFYLVCAGILGMMLPLSSCGNGASVSSSTSEVKFSLSSDSQTVLFGQTYQLTVNSSVKGEVTWSTSNEAVAKVDQEGLVEAIGNGEATITATLGSLSATCLIKVSFGDVIPSLELEGVPENNSVSLIKGSCFSVQPKVLFGGKTFDTDVTVSSDNESVATYENGMIMAKGKGVAYLSFASAWQGFDAPSLRKTILVSVDDEVSIVAGYIKDGKQVVTNRINLSVLSSWQGKTYENEATLFANAYEGSALMTGVTFSLTSTDAVTLTDNVVKAKATGTCVVLANYTSKNGETYSFPITIEVTCPVATYDANLRLCVSDAFPVEEIFGEDAIILSASQNGKQLEVKRGSLVKGIPACGDDNEPLEIQTNKGGFVFTNLFTYTAALTADNIFSTLSLASGKVIDGYYILEEDILETVDFTSQGESAYSKGATTNTYFSGTFDGQGHTVKALVGSCGMFGGFGEFAKVTRTHFEFTFAPGSISVGLAKNSATFVQKDWNVTIENNYITTTNYLANSYALMDFRFNHLTLKNNYIVLSGTEKLDSYKKATDCQAALFRIDAVIFQGPYTSYDGEFRNNHVITGRFMPISDGIWMTDSAGKDQVWVGYAKNDTDELGNFIRQTNDSTQFGYSILTPYGSDTKEELFGHLGDGWFSSDTLALSYSSRGDIADGGIYRYDARSELVFSGIERIGDWIV